MIGKPTTYGLPDQLNKLHQQGAYHPRKDSSNSHEGLVKRCAGHIRYIDSQKPENEHWTKAKWELLPKKDFFIFKEFVSVGPLIVQIGHHVDNDPQCLNSYEVKLLDPDEMEVFRSLFQES